VRQRAARRGYIVRKSRRGWPLDNEGEFMLVEASSNIPALGFRYDASLDEITEYLKD
jgi:hypothetical protein